MARTDPMAPPADYHAIAARVHNWGRWGEADEAGTLNLITDEVVRDAAAAVRTGRRIPLAVPLRQDGIQIGAIPGRVNPLHTMTALNLAMFTTPDPDTPDTGSGPAPTIATSDDTVTMGLQSGTHWDALAHVSRSGRIYNNRPADSVTAHGGAAFSGVDKAGPVVSRGVLLDVARARTGDRNTPGRLAGDHAVTPDDLDAAERLAGVRVRPGDIVLVRTGWIQHYLAGDRNGYTFPSPGLSIHCPEWFHARDTAAVANDTLTFEIVPPEDENLWLPVHALHLVEMGMPQGQNWNLEELSAACADTGRYAFLLSATPEPFTGGTGAPVAPVAVL